MTLKKNLINIFRRFCKKSNIVQTTILLKIGTRLIGAVHSVSIDDDEIRGNINIVLGRCRFDRNRVSEAFARDYVSANSQRLPLQIEIDDGTNITTITNAWISGSVTSQSLTYISKDYLIVDELSLQAQEITTKESLFFKDL